MKNKIVSLAVIVSVLAGLGLSTFSYAQTPGQIGSEGASMHWGGVNGQHMQGVPGIAGTVSAINGTTLTVASMGRGFGFGKMGSSTPATAEAATTYTVDASNATVTNNRAASTLSSIAVGNFVMISGTVSGTSITATKINFSTTNPGMENRNGGPKNASSTANMIQGNGEPIVGGTVSAISGTSITITNKGSASYTIDASGATVTKGDQASSVSNIAVGDSILVQGTINGTSVTAATITDQSKAPNANGKPAAKGFFGAIGSFFSRLFGF